MKTAFKFLFFCTLSIFFLSANRTDISLEKTGVQHHPTDSIEVNTLVNISRKDFEKRIGRKLGIFERAALKKTKKKYREYPNWIMDDRKVPTEAVLSSVFSFGGLAVMIVSIASGFKNDNAETGITGSFIGLLAILVGGVLGILGVRKINKNIEEWKGRGFAMAGVVILSIFLVILLTVFL